MKRVLLFVLSIVCMTLSSYAQRGMTDSQIIDFIKKEVSAGTSQNQIAAKLVQRGVTPDQIRKLRDQYEREQSAANNSKSTTNANPTSTTNANPASTTNPTGYNNQMVNTTNVNTNMANGTNVTRQVIGQNGVSDSVSDFEDTIEKEDEGPKIFGHDIFNRRLLSFEPSMSIAVPRTYVLGPGDMVTIEIYGASQRTIQEVVSRDGTITVPDYGPIALSGMTVTQAQETLKSQLGARYVSSEMRLTVSQTRTIMVNVMGEVRTPGTYHLSSFASVFHALYMAGGINNLGTLRDVKVYRKGRLLTTVDIYDYILNGKLTGDISLEDQDLVQVGTYDCLVGIDGNVKRPMSYEMRTGESMGKVIDYAGGFTGDAFHKAVRLIRKAGDNYSVFNVDEFNLSAFKIVDGDSIFVDSVLERYSNMVEVTGAIFRPGMYELGANIYSVKTLIEGASGLTEEAFANHALLNRLKKDRTMEVISVDVLGIMNGIKPDIPLQNEDVLFIPTQTDQLEQRTLNITGMVLFPGAYQYADNMTIEDMILLAGGLRDEASTARVDVSRRILNPKATTTTGRLAQTFSFSIRDGLLVDSKKDFILEPYDVVHVRKSPGYSAPRQITVSGEVIYEGEHTLEVKNTRLSDAIRMAGGLTPDAYVKGAQLQRTMNEEELKVREALIQGLDSSNDSVRLSLLEKGNVYTVGINLEKALKEPGGDYDLVLRENDRLFVPEYSGTVKVSGEVFQSNTVSYDARKGYKWYIDQAGGFTKKSLKRHTYIVYQNGTMMRVKKGAKVEPGCEIVVPTKPEKSGATLQQWISIGSGLTSIAAMVATIARMVK